VYFSTADDVALLLEYTESDVASTRARGKQSADRASLYDWETVIDRYEALCHRLITKRGAGPHAFTAAAHRPPGTTAADSPAPPRRSPTGADRPLGRSDSFHGGAVHR